MKKILLFLSLLACVNVVYAVSPNCELYIINFVTDKNLYVRFYPTGAIYHKEIIVTNTIERYTIRSQSFEPGNGTKIGIKRIGELSLNNRLRYIVGLDGFALNNRSPYPGYFEIKPDLTGISYDKWLLLGNDASANSDLDGLFGFGEYILEIYKTTNSGTSFQQIVQIPIDWLDFNYPYSPGTGGSQDLFLRIYSISPLYITFQWSSTVQGDELPLFGSGSPPYDGGIQIYKQYHRFDTTLAEWMGYNLHNEHPPSKGNSVSDSYFLSYPLDGRDLPYPYTIPVHINPGEIKCNLTVDDTISTLDSLNDTVSLIKISDKSLFRLNDGKIFHMITPSYPSGGYTNLIIGEDSAKLQLRPNSQIIADPPNRITLKNGGFLLKNPGSRITINPGAYLCNEGGSIRGSGIIYYTGGIHQSMCNQLTDYLLQDSVKFILDSNAILPIPNNTTLHLKGNTTSLIMKPGSKLLFGENSGIVCDSGGKVIADNATFASIDSTKKWNGISLSDLSQDTIKNCIIKNAMYGISISDKYDAEDTGIDYSAEISGCTFINQTNYVLNSAVYIAGSNNVLIMNNSVSSSALEKGFTHGIYVEYCPEGVFNLIGNDISGAGNGMTLIGCSPFVAQNTLTGNEYSDCGLFLDNSNGTFEYNVISDFYYSYFSYYSSPDLLKNVFDNYYDDNIWLSSSSVPVMHPLINAGSVYWYAGDNTINGSPSNACLAYL